MPALLGQKLGMTQIYTDDGRQIPVTAIQAGPCQIVAKKDIKRDGYAAIQIGFGCVKERNLTKAARGHLKKVNAPSYRYLREIRTNQADYVAGDVLTVGSFVVGDMVDVTGKSKGKGFQGVMKRHNFGGMPATHGVSLSHRVPGSIGQRTWPGRVIPGKKMPGHMGGDKVTQKGLEIVGIELEDNILFIKGAVPGATNSLVLIRARSEDFEKRFLATKQVAPAQVSEQSS